jgi:hypothetical protein
MRRLGWPLALPAGIVSMGLIVGYPLLAGPVSAGEMAALAAKRFAQPVRVGSLIDRAVLEPVESRALLGHVLRVVRLSDGTIDIVMRYGGFLGWGGRTIGVPIDAVALLGGELVMVGYTAPQLDGLPKFEAVNAVSIPAGALIPIGLTRPSH